MEDSIGPTNPVDRMSKWISSGGPRRRWMLVLLLIIAIVGIVIAGLFASRMMRRGRPPLPPRETNVSLIAGWMTVDYIARTFRIPPEELFHELDIPATRRDPRSLNDLAAQGGRSSDELVAAARAAVEKLQIAFPRPKPGDPPDRQQSKPPPESVPSPKP